jgi:hypothetical protein
MDGHLPTLLAVCTIGSFVILLLAALNVIHL